MAHRRRDDGRAGRSTGRTGARPGGGRSPPDTETADATTRRRLLVVTRGTLAASTLPGLATAGHSNHYVIGAQTSHWAGEEPSDIAGEENPTLSMTVGEEYTVTWHNRDGNYHKLLIRNEDNEVLARSPGNNEQGGTEAVTFVVTEEMDNYQCEPHFSMNGDIDTQGSSSSTPTASSEPTESSTSTETATEPSSTSTESRTPSRTETRTASDSSTPDGTETPADSATESPTSSGTDTATPTDEQGDGGEPAQTVDDADTETEGIEGDTDDQAVFGTASLVAGAGLVGYLRRRFGDDD